MKYNLIIKTGRGIMLNNIIVDINVEEIIFGSDIEPIIIQTENCPYKIWLIKNGNNYFTVESHTEILNQICPGSNWKWIDWWYWKMPALLVSENKQFSSKDAKEYENYLVKEHSTID